MKVCSKCHKLKKLTSFYVRKSGKKIGQYYNHCKHCLRGRGILYYKSNRERLLKLANKRRQVSVKTKKEFVYSLKDKPCSDCGKKYPHYVMDFDHRKGEEKTANIAHLISQNYYSKEKLLVEISKCDLVCANCHRIRIFKYLNLSTK